ncbi:hypothetical protein Q7P37_007915 [Cladosporium fusiforme]
MVAGKDTAKHLAKVASAPTLPPLPKLRIRKPDQTNENPCLGVMSTVLGCWASSGHTAQGCAQLEQALRTCMDAKVKQQESYLLPGHATYHFPQRPSKPQKNPINKTLSRLYPKIIGPHKRK